MGSKKEDMILVVQNREEQTITTMNEDDRPISFYNIEEDFHIHVYDANPNSILTDFDDLSAVEKYMISEQDYDSLP